jgi:hypothetical protein
MPDGVSSSPVSFVTLKDGSLILEPSAETLLSSLVGPISIVASIGSDRVASRAALEHFTDAGVFAAEGGTSAIRLWSSAEKRPNGSTTVVLDVQPSSEGNSALDGQLFSLAALVSSCLLYSSKGLLDDDTFVAAKSILAVPKHLHAEAGQEDGSQLHAHFPPFFWTMHEATIPSGQSSKKYLDTVLKDQSTATAHTRLHFHTLFKQLDCVSTGSGEQIAKKVFPHLKPKHLFGHVLDASMLLGLVRECVDTFNSQQPVVIPVTWKKLQGEQSQNALDVAHTGYMQGMHASIKQYDPELDRLEHEQERREFDADMAAFMTEQAPKGNQVAASPMPAFTPGLEATLSEIDADAIDDGHPECTDFDADGNLRFHKPAKTARAVAKKGRFDFWSRRRKQKEDDDADAEKAGSKNEKRTSKMVRGSMTSKEAAKRFDVPRTKTVASAGEATAAAEATADAADGVEPEDQVGALPQVEAKVDGQSDATGTKAVCILPVAEPKLEQLHQKQLALAQRLLLMSAPTAPDNEKRQLQQQLGVQAEAKLCTFTEANADASAVQGAALITHLHSFVQYLEPVAATTEVDGAVHGSAQCRHIGSDISTYRSELRHVLAEYNIRAEGPKKTAALASFMCTAVLDRMVGYGEHCNEEHRVHMAQMGTMLNEKRALRKRFQEEKEETARQRAKERAEFIRKHEEVAGELAEKQKVLKSKLSDTGHELDKSRKRVSLVSSSALAHQQRATKFVEEVMVKIDPPLEGYLRKQGGKMGMFLVKNWKERFFRLENNCLAYYDSRDSFERRLPPLHDPIDLSGEGVEVKPSKTAGDGFEIHVPQDKDGGRVFNIRALNMTDKDQWFDALTRATTYMERKRKATSAHWGNAMLTMNEDEDEQGGQEMTEGAGGEGAEVSEGGSVEAVEVAVEAAEGRAATGGAADEAAKAAGERKQPRASHLVQSDFYMKKGRKSSLSAKGRKKSSVDARKSSAAEQRKSATSNADNLDDVPVALPLQGGVEEAAKEEEVEWRSSGGRVVVEKEEQEEKEEEPKHRALQTLARAKAHAEGGPTTLFIIHRSNNTNSIVYKGDALKGVTVLWIMFEKKGEPTEGLTFAEKQTAYGYKAKPVKGQGFQWTLEMSALSDRKLSVKFSDNVWTCTTRIDGVENVGIRAVHVEMKKNTMFPAVDYIEIFGLGGAYERKKA